MTEKPNFFKLGIFILIAIALIVGGLILFGSGAFAKEKVYFETYFTESVHGLSQGSPVLLTGVKIGEVEEVTFVRKSYDIPEDARGISEYDQYVRVIFSAIEEELPKYETERGERVLIYLKKGLRVRLASNLITGQAYLEALLLDPERFPAKEVPWKPQFTYIPSAPSVFRTMQDSADKILQKLEQVDFKKISDNINATLESITQAIADANIGAVSNKAALLVDELRQSNQDLQKLIKSPEVEKELDNIPVLIDRFNRSLSRLDQLIAHETPEMREIIENIRQLTENLNYLSEHLKDNPSELLFSTPPPKKEK